MSTSSWVRSVAGIVEYGRSAAAANPVELQVERRAQPQAIPHIGTRDLIRSSLIPLPGQAQWRNLERTSF